MFKMLPEIVSHFNTYISVVQPFTGTNVSSKSNLWLQYRHTRKINTSLYQPQGNNPYLFSEGESYISQCVCKPASKRCWFVFWGCVKKCDMLACTTLRSDKINHYQPQTWLFKMCIHLARGFSITQTTKLLAFPSNMKISNSFWKAGY